MLIKSKREFFWLKYRFEIVISVSAILGMAFGFLGRDYASFERLNGVVECNKTVETICNSVVLPVVAIILSKLVGNPSKMAMSVMGAKIAATVLGAVFGINANIHLPLFHGDWGILFFVAVDVFIIFAIRGASDARKCVFYAITVVTAVMMISHIILQLDGDASSDYPFRIAYLMMFYYSVGYVVFHTARRWMHAPTPEEWAKINLEEGDSND